VIAKKNSDLESGGETCTGVSARKEEKGGGGKRDEKRELGVSEGNEMVLGKNKIKGRPKVR